MTDSRRRPLLVATRNPGKLRELQPMLAAAGFAAIDLTMAGIEELAEEETLEVAPTFIDNALAKAHYFHQRSGIATIADDSGLVVPALGGAPGVRSKRYSGRSDLRGPALDAANNAALLAALRTVEDRAASFVCAVAYVDASVSHAVEGRTDGRMVGEAGEGTFGFGYDPYFRSDDLGVTFAEASLEAKASVSHRGRAIAALVAWLRARESEATERLADGARTESAGRAEPTRRPEIASRVGAAGSGCG